MSNEWSTDIPQSLAGYRLDRALVACAAQLGSPLPLSEAKALVSSGGVQLNGRVERTVGRLVSSPSTLSWSLKKKPVTPAIPVLYRDADIVVINKPAGMLSQPGRGGQLDDVVTLLHRQGEQEGLPYTYLALHHRLDRETSGILILSSSKRANPGLSDGFKRRRITKFYLALVAGVPHANTWESRGHLESHPDKPGLQRSTEPTDNSKPAHSRFRTVTQSDEITEIEATPVTGRTHQLRVHLSDVDLPVLGDTRYGGPRYAAGVSVPRHMLHAHKVAFRHPVTGVSLSFEAAPPEDFEALRPTAADRDTGSA